MKYSWFVLFICLSLTVMAQNSSKVKQLEKQRKAALAEIEMTNQLLKETSQTAKNSLNRLNLIVNQILSRKKVINILSEEVTAIDQQMGSMQSEINKLERELGGKRANYSKSVKGLYKRHSSQDKLLYILSADNFSQSLRRLRYLREYADWQKRQATEIIGKQQEIAHKRAELEKVRSDKRSLLGVREQESQKLQTEESSQKIEVQQLTKKQKQLQADLKKKQRQADALNRRIEQQIAEEIARAEAEAKAERERLERERIARLERERRAREKAAAEAAAIASNNKKSSRKKAVEKPAPEPAPEPTPEPIREERVAETKGGYAMTRAEKRLSDDFAGNQGRLPYPVSGRHTIVATFGVQQHQELKYVRTNNSGIDIQTSPGTDARSIFNGVVTRVFVVPGYNNSVIVRHGN
ncbi:MAG: peptidase M24, partial [Tannerellaceae bacterium]